MGTTAAPLTYDLLLLFLPRCCDITSLCCLLRDRPPFPPTLSPVHWHHTGAIPKGSWKEASGSEVEASSWFILKLRNNQSQSKEAWLSQRYSPGGWLFSNEHIHHLLHFRWIDERNPVLRQTFRIRVFSWSTFKACNETWKLFCRPHGFNWQEGMGKIFFF